MLWILLHIQYPIFFLRTNVELYNAGNGRIFMIYSYTCKLCMILKMTSLEKTYRHVKKNRNRHLKLAVSCIISWAVFSYVWLYFYLDKSLPVGTYSPVSKVKLIQLVKNNVPNLPERYFRNPDELKFVDDHDPCEKYPSLEDLAFNNDFWQELNTTENGICYLYTAYYDDRPLTGTSEYKNTTKDSKQAMVRILALIKPKVRLKFLIKPEDRLKYYCQLWFKDTMNHTLVQISSIERLSKELVDGEFLSDSLLPYMLNCPVPEQYKSMVPVSVSLLEKPCQYITNNVQIVSTEVSTRDGNKEDFCVCVLGLDDQDFPDFFNRFIEWMEMLALLGVDKVVLYEQHIKSEIYPLLYYYIRKGLLELVELRMPKANGQTTHAEHVNHLSYNDCLYKSIYSYNYITTLAINEIFIPKRILTTWKDVINLVKAYSRVTWRQEPSTFIFRNAYFTETMQSYHGRNYNIPQYLLMQQNVHRSTLYSPEEVYVGSIHDTNRVTVLEVHGITKCLDNNCFTGLVDPREGLMHRYQKNLTVCVGETVKSCAMYGENTTLDTDIYKYRENVDTLFKESITFLNYTG